MLGFSKTFAIVLIVAAIISFGMRNYFIGIQIVAGYAIVRIVWNIFTK